VLKKLKRHVDEVAGAKAPGAGAALPTRPNRRLDAAQFLQPLTQAEGQLDALRALLHAAYDAIAPVAATAAAAASVEGAAADGAPLPDWAALAAAVAQLARTHLGEAAAAGADAPWQAAVQSVAAWAQQLAQLYERSLAPDAVVEINAVRGSRALGQGWARALNDALPFARVVGEHNKQTAPPPWQQQGDAMRAALAVNPELQRKIDALQGDLRLRLTDIKLRDQVCPEHIDFSWE